MKTKVYILGAGASKPAGAPVLKEFIGTGIFHLRDGDASPDRIGNYEKFFDYLKNKYGFDLWSSDPYKSDPFLFGERNNIEQIISSIDEEINAGDNHLIGVKHETVRFIYCTLENAVRDGSINNCYPDFVDKKIKDLNDEHIILTFNYETLLERSLSQKFWGCFSYLLDVDENKIINFPSYKKSDTNIVVLKLHGSLNWATCPSCSKMHIFWSQRYDNIFREKCRDDCNNNLEPILIAPTRYKNISEGNLKKLWDIASEKIKVADEITVIGCALNDYDKGALELIKDSIRANRKTPKLLIADPNAQEIKEKVISNLSVDSFSSISLFEDFRRYLN